MKTKPKSPPTLGAVAAAANDEKKQAKAKGMLATALAMLGIGGTAQPTAGKMRKVTETHKHVKLEEEEGGSDADSSAEEEEEEEEREAEESSTDMTGSDADSTGTEKSEEEEGEEEEAGAAEEEEEEASVKGLGRAVRAAYRSPEVKAAFLAAIPKGLRAAAALRTPDRLFREVRKSTGAKTIDGAMTALSRQRTKAAAGDARVIKATATLAAKVTKIEAGQRAQRVEAIVKQAKAEGRAGSHDLREQLRAYGQANGSKALRALVATLPKARTTEDGERLPKTDSEGNAIGMPGNEDQEAMLARATAGMSEKERAEFLDIYKTKAKALNGAGRLA